MSSEDTATDEERRAIEDLLIRHAPLAAAMPDTLRRLADDIAALVDEAHDAGVAEERRRARPDTIEVRNSAGKLVYQALVAPRSDFTWSPTEPFPGFGSVWLLRAAPAVGEPS